MFCKQLSKRIVAILILLAFMSGCSNNSVETEQPKQLNYVGSVKSDKYHYPDCRWAQNIKPENEIWFSSTEEAEEQGYAPCKTCQP